MKKLFTLSILLLFIASAIAQQGLTLEAPSQDVTLTVRGPEKEIQSLNKLSDKKGNNLILFTHLSKDLQKDLKGSVLLILDKNQMVIEVINNGRYLPEIPNGGVVIAAVGVDDSMLSSRFLTTKFNIGDVARFRLNGEIKTIDEVARLVNNKSSLSLNQTVYSTSDRAKFDLSGSLSNFDSKGKYNLAINNGRKNTALALKDAKFSTQINLQPGVNYISVSLQHNSETVDKRELVVFYKEKSSKSSERIMWVEQFPNAKTLLTEADVEAVILESKKNGITSFGLDVKGPEGYVSYRKNDLSKSPYYSEIKAEKKRTNPEIYDLLEAFTTIAHKHGMKVYASFNIFTEGNVGLNESPLLDLHPDWEEVVQRPEDKGALLPNSKTIAAKEAREGKRVILSFVNPSNPEVQDFQLARIEEVLKNYDVDGVVLDRCRYDNLYADFSDLSKKQFEAYLAEKGKKLNAFPQDAFIINSEGQRIDGQYFNEWITFRSSVIKKFTDRARSLVDSYKRKKNEDIKLMAYVGSWYESYWQNGVNWASASFKYNPVLKFPEERLYTDSYRETSYLHNLDLLMIGTYYKTEQEINKYITLGNILTDGKLPLVAGVSLPDLKEGERPEVFAACLKNSSGIMFFDLCYIDWKSFTDSILKTNDLMK